MQPGPAGMAGPEGKGGRTGTDAGSRQPDLCGTSAGIFFGPDGPGRKKFLYPCDSPSRDARDLPEWFRLPAGPGRDRGLGLRGSHGYRPEVPPGRPLRGLPPPPFLETSSPMPRSGPCKAPDCPPGRSRNGLWCKTRVVPCKGFPSGHFKGDSGESGHFAVNCKTKTGT